MLRYLDDIIRVSKFGSLKFQNWGHNTPHYQGATCWNTDLAVQYKQTKRYCRGPWTNKISQ